MESTSNILVEYCSDSCKSDLAITNHMPNCVKRRGPTEARHLCIGDTVKLADLTFCYTTVKNIRDGVIHFFRPYTHIADFSYTGGVICYVGIETFSAYLDSGALYEIVERRILK